jgi:hypothetical protein
MQPTSGYSPQENIAAERLNRTLWETTLTILADSGLPKKWWAEVVVHASHIHNVTNATGGPTPWEQMKGEEPDLSTLKIFGAPCMVKAPNSHFRACTQEAAYMIKRHTCAVGGALGQHLWSVGDVGDAWARQRLGRRAGC